MTEQEDAIASPDVDHVADGGVFGVDAAQKGPITLSGPDEVERLVDLVEGGEREEVMWWNVTRRPRCECQ